MVRSNDPGRQKFIFKFVVFSQCFPSPTAHFACTNSNVFSLTVLYGNWHYIQIQFLRKKWKKSLQKILHLWNQGIHNLNICKMSCVFGKYSKFPLVLTIGILIKRNQHSRHGLVKKEVWNKLMKSKYWCLCHPRESISTRTVFKQISPKEDSNSSTFNQTNGEVLKKVT